MVIRRLGSPEKEENGGGGGGSGGEGIRKVRLREKRELRLMFNMSRHGDRLSM
jgi:hypothetical protein